MALNFYQGWGAEHMEYSIQKKGTANNSNLSEKKQGIANIEASLRFQYWLGKPLTGKNQT